MAGIFKFTSLVVFCCILRTGITSAEPQTPNKGPNQPTCLKPILPAKLKLDGIWLGILKAPGAELRVVFKIRRKPDGTLTATIDSPDQGAKDIPVDEVAFEGDNLYLESKRIQGVFDGKIKEDGSTIEGHWKQSGHVLPLVVKRVAEAPKIHGLQEPEKSYAEPQPPAKEPDQPDYAKPIPPEKLKEDLDFLFKTIEEAHPNMYAYTPKEEFTKYCDKLYRQINRPMNSREFYKLVAPTVASLKNGHTSICPFSLTGNDKIFPIGLRWVGQDVILQNDYAGNALPLGGKILTINGKDARKVIQKLARYSPDEYQETNLREIERPGFLWVWLWLEYGKVESLDLRIKAIDGRVKDYVVKAVPLEQVKKLQRYDKKENYTYRYMPEYHTGLIEFNRFVDFETFEKFLHDTFKKLKEQQASSLIIDIRENRGGNSSLGDALLDYLTDKPFRQFEEYLVKVSAQADNIQRIRQNMPQAKAQIGSLVTIDVPFKKPKDNPLRFNDRKFVLIGQTTFSSANCFASAIKCFKIATLIGEETGGTTTSYGDCLNFYLPNSNLGLDVAHKYFVEASGKPDGRGVIPDYEVKQKPEDTAKGVDTVLQFTLNLIKKSGSKIPLEPKQNNQVN